MNTPKPEEQVAAKLDSAPDNAEQKPSVVPASLGQAVGDSVQSVLEDPRIAEEWRKRSFLVIEDDPRINGPICDGLRQKGAPENKVVGVFDGESAKNAIDQFLSQAQGGECLTLICDMEFPNRSKSLGVDPFAGRSVIQHALRAFKQWKKSHPDETNPPPKLEILMNSSRISAEEFKSLTESFQGFDSELDSTFIGFSPKKEKTCFAVLQKYFERITAETSEEYPKDGFFITGDELLELEQYGFGWLYNKILSWGMPEDRLVTLFGPPPDNKKAIARITKTNFSPGNILQGDVHVDIVRWIS